MLVQWGDIELSIDVERPDFSPLQSISMQFQDSESYPTCSIEFTTDIIGYEAYRKCISEQYRDEPIIISLGYPRGSWFSAKFYYAGASLGSGNSATISVSGSSKKKDFLSSFNTNLSLESTLAELPKKIQEAVSSGKQADLVATEFTPLAQEVASQTKVDGIIGTGQTPGRIMLNQMRAQGLDVDLTATADPNRPHAKVVAPPLANAQKDTYQPKDAALVDQISLGEDCYGFLLGPGLLRDMTRSISWGPESGQNAKTTPASLLVPVGAEPRDTANPDEKAVEEPKAPAGWDLPPAAYTVTEESNPSLGLELKALREIQDKFTCTGSFFMVPALVGIKPRDFLFLPSLRNDYLEDWFLDSVSYQFDASGCQVSFSGFRLALDPTRKMVTTATYDFFLDKLKSFETIEDWENYYWRVNQKGVPQNTGDEFRVSAPLPPADSGAASPNPGSSTGNDQGATGTVKQTYNGKASWYGPGFNGKKTANGETFDQNGLTAAHKTLPFGTKVRVTYGGQSVIVRINDRGPYTPGREIDLAKGAADKIGLTGAGVGEVKIEVLGN